LWFVVGIYIIPTFLKRSRKWMANETLLIVSLALGTEIFIDVRGRKLKAVVVKAPFRK
jgi:hypothetical protein